MALHLGHEHHPVAQQDWEEISDNGSITSLSDSDIDADDPLNNSAVRLKRRPLKLDEPPPYEVGEAIPPSPAAALTPRRVSFRLTDQQKYSSAEERAVVRKLDHRVTLFLSFLYLLGFVDRSNMGNAKIFGLTDQLGLDSAHFEWLLTAFYITYIGFEWLALLYRVLPAHNLIGGAVFSWGLVASGQAVVTSFGQLLVLRLLLGISEAAFGPGVPFYLSFFYKPEELAFRVGLFISSAPLATSFASSLAWAIGFSSHYLPISSWRLLFLVEGFPSVLAALWAWLLLPDSPGKAAFLTSRERKIARVRLQTGENCEVGRKKSELGEKKQPLKVSLLLNAIIDPRTILTSLMFFSCNVAFSSLPVFLPTIIEAMDFSPLQSQALSAPPYLAAFASVLITARVSDRLRVRSTFVALHALVAAFGYSLMGIAAEKGWSHWYRYVGSFGAAIGFFSAITIIITWTINNQVTDEGKGMAITVLNVIGQCGPLLGTRLYPETDAPLYVEGSTACALFMYAVVVLALLLRFVLGWQNTRKDRDEGIGRRRDAEDEQMEMTSIEERGKRQENKKGFRFII